MIAKLRAILTAFPDDPISQEATLTGCCRQTNPRTR